MMDLNFPECDLITPFPKQNEQAEQIILFRFTETFSGSAACDVSLRSSFPKSLQLSQPFFAGYLQ